MNNNQLFKKVLQESRSWGREASSDFMDDKFNLEFNNSLGDVWRAGYIARCSRTGYEYEDDFDLFMPDKFEANLTLKEIWYAGYYQRCEDEPIEDDDE